MKNLIARFVFFKIEETIKRKEKYYIHKYGLVPEFKAGLHCGKVVTTQVGDIKSEIVYHGDVLNTAARIQELCNFYGYTLLMSDTLADLMVPPRDVFIYKLDKVQLRGKASLTGLMAVTMQKSTQMSSKHAVE